MAGMLDRLQSLKGDDWTVEDSPEPLPAPKSGLERLQGLASRYNPEPQAAPPAPGKYGKFSSLIESAAQQHKIDPALLAGILQQESGMRPDAVGPTVELPGPLKPEEKYINARGIAQLIPSTAKALGVTDPTDVNQAIPAAAKLLRQNLDRYEGDERKAIMAYHGGYDESRWGPKTQAYLPAVQRQRATFGGAENIAEPAMRTAVQKDVEGTGWGKFQEFANGIFLGYGMPVAAATAAAKNAFQDWQSGTPLREAVNKAAENYGYYKNVGQYSRGMYQSEHPIESAFAGGAGATMTSIPIMNALGIPALASSAEAVPGFVGRTLARAGAGAVEGATAGALQTGLGGDLTDNMLLGGAAGAGMRAVVAPTLGQLWRRSFGSNIPSEYAKQANTLLEHDIPVTQGQLKGGAPLARLGESVFGWDDTKQLQAFTKAVGKEIGLDSSSLNSTAINSRMRQLGGTLDSIATGKLIPSWDAQLYNELAAVRKSIMDNVGVAEAQKTPLYNRLTRALNEFRSGGITGEQFRDLVRSGGTLADAATSSGMFQHEAGEARKSLLSAFMRHIPRAEAEAYQEASRQYGNALRILGAVDDKAQLVDPGKLFGRLLRQSNRMGMGPEQAYGELGELATAANRTLSSVASTEKAPLSFRRLGPLAVAGGAAGGEYALYQMNPAMAKELLAAAAIFGGTAGGSHLVLNKMLTRAIIDQAMGKPMSNVLSPALLADLAVRAPGALSHTSVPMAVNALRSDEGKNYGQQGLAYINELLRQRQ